MFWSVTPQFIPLRLNISAVVINTVKTKNNHEERQLLFSIPAQSFYKEIIAYGGKSNVKVLLAKGAFPDISSFLIAAFFGIKVHIFLNQCALPLISLLVLKSRPP